MKHLRSKHFRYLAAFGFGIATLLFIGILNDNWLYAPLLGWDVTALTLLLTIAGDMRGAIAKTTGVVARRDDMNHSLMDILALLASVASIGAVVYLLASPEKSAFHVAFCLVSIVLSWATVHMIYALRYTTMYYRDEEGGVDFNGKEKPRFRDFLYLAYTIGMTYQVSDTSFQTSEFRRVALGHALVSFMFGVAILATTINFLASLSK